jgi:hypothetical protein
MDWESDGPVPGLYNAISFSIVSLEHIELGQCLPKSPLADDTCSFSSTWFYSGISPELGSPGLEKARNISGVSYDRQRTFPDAGFVFHELDKWLKGHLQGTRPIFWSDNPAYDWPWFNYHMTKRYGGQHPYGWSCRRIGDYWAGLQKNPRDTGGWRNFVKTEHDHNPLHDAVGMAEGLHHILTRGTKK